MNKVAQDFRYTLRQLRLNPAFTIVSVVTLAVGIGGTVAIFALANALLLRPLPVEAPGELVVIDEEREGLTYVMNSMTAFSYPRYEALREATGGIFSGLGGSLMGQVSVLAGDEAEVLEAVITSGNYFQVLGLRPALGRFFTDADVHEPLLMGFAGLGVILGIVGVYGVISYAVARRSGELGVRFALGATPRNVLANVMKRAMRPVAIGVVLGMVGAIGLTRVLSGVVVDVHTADPWVLGSVAVVLVMSGAAAALIPATRATRISPVRALQAD
jgi:hypothetical protein